MQALNLLQESQVTAESIVRKPMPVKALDQCIDQSGSSTTQTQAQPVTLVSFGSTTQVRMDTVIGTKIYQWYLIWLRKEVPGVLLQIGYLAGER